MKLPKINLNAKPNYLSLKKDIEFFGLFQKIEAKYENCFLFESLGEYGKQSRYSIMGFDPEYILSAKDHKLMVAGKDFKVANP